MSIKQIIIQHLEENGDWVWGGTLDSHVHDILNSKTSNVSRRARELVNEGFLETDYKQVNGKGPKCVRYRIKKEREQGQLLTINKPTRAYHQ